MDRITDCSPLSPEDIKNRNRKFYRNPDHTYLIEARPAAVVKRRISNVRNGDLRRVLRNFPIDEPLYAQCAHWMHALVGKQFFPDANHRTAMLTLEYLLDENGISSLALPGPNVVDAIRQSKFTVKNLVNVRLDTLWRKDELYLVWRRHFARVL